MLDKAVRSLRVAEQTMLTAQGDVRHEVQYTYHVGPHGPFTLRYKRGEDTPEQVKTDTDAQVRKLRELGALEE